MKNKKQLQIIGIFFIIAAMLISTSASAINIEKNKQILQDNQILFESSSASSSTPQTTPFPRDAGGLNVWDNGMNYDSMLPAQETLTQGSLDAYPADDFQFVEDTEVSTVYWIGGFFYDDPQEWDWCIVFFEDRGDGNAPGNQYAGPFQFTWENIEKEEIEFGYYEMRVDLSENVFFSGGKNYWICIWAIGDLYAQSGWGCHSYPITMNESVFESVYFEIFDWTNFSLILGFPIDMCFQLYYKDVNLTISIDRQLFLGKIHASIKNTGNAEISNVNWYVQIVAGVRKKSDSFGGSIDTINFSKTAKIQTGRFIGQSAIKFRFGRISGEISAFVGDYNTTLEFSGFIFGRLIFIPKNQF